MASSKFAHGAVSYLEENVTFKRMQHSFYIGQNYLSEHL